MAPLLAIVGRPNVGKSTLFNRLVRDRRALVDNMPGVTRDRLYGNIDVFGKEMRVIDTGGLDLGSVDNIITGIRDQAIAAINEASAIAFVVDTKDGLTPADEEIARYLRQYNKPIIVAANKVDTRKHETRALEFQRLGFENMVPISAEHGDGVGDLLELLLELLPSDEEFWQEEPEDFKVAIIGRPNVGKSSILNAILGDERTIVSPVAGTTRDVIDVGVEVEGIDMTFLDTAGIRKKSAIHEKVEVISSIKARQTIKRADCCILVINAVDGVTSQDKALAGMIDRESHGAIVALNKWDLVVGSFPAGEEGDRFIKEIVYDLKFLSYAPVISTSALKGTRVPRLIDALMMVAESQRHTYSTGEMNQFLEVLLKRNPPPAHKGKPTEIFKISHVSNKPALFRIFVRGFVPGNYLKYIENSIRAHFDLTGIPMSVAVKRV